MNQIIAVIAFTFCFAAMVQAAEPTLTRPTFGWVPGLQIEGQVVFEEIDAVVNPPQSNDRMLWMGRAAAESPTGSLLNAGGTIHGDRGKADFTWTAEPGKDQLEITLHLTLDEIAVKRGDAMVRLVIPGSQIAGASWIAGGRHGGSGWISDKPSDRDHIVVKGSDGWFAWQLADRSWVRVTPGPGSIAKWQVQDNRKFGSEAFEMQMYAPHGMSDEAEPLVRFNYTIEHLMGPPVVEPPQPPVVDLGPDVAMLRNEGPAEIVSVELLENRGNLHDFYEFAVDLKASYENPFDVMDVRLDARFVDERGVVMTVPAFFEIGYDRSLDERGWETVAITREHGWRVRFRPPAPGQYELELVLDDGTGIVRSEPMVFEASGPLERADYIRVSPTNPLAFSVGDDGETSYVPVGMNVAWPSDPGSYDYEKYWARLSEHGANYARVWLAPTFTRLCLERPAQAGQPSTGLGKIDQRAAMRVDRLVNGAEEHGIRLMLCTESFGNFSSNTKASGQWDQCVYNVAQGGPLEEPAEFFTNAIARQSYRNRLRYIVARWGHSPSVFAWEFWNEVTYVDDFKDIQPAVILWHAEMSDYLAAIDPYDHLVTTSFGGAEADPRIDSLPGIDLTQSHMYGVDDIPGTIRRVAWKKAQRFGKPHLFGELGISHLPVEVNLDARGQHLHDMLWSGLFSPTPATAMSWWWDNYVEPMDLWGAFEPVSRFVRGVPVARGPVCQAREVSIRFKGTPPSAQPTPIFVSGGLKSWSAGLSNTPSDVTVAADGGLTGADHLSGLLHGTGNHAELHNPVTFNVRYAIDGDFTVDVQTVSGYGGGKLKIYLDEVLALDEAFIDEDGEDENVQPHTEPLARYNGKYTVAVPAGSHTIRVVNDGADWLEVGYVFNGVNLRQTPWLDVHTLLVPSARLGEPMALLWVRNLDAHWNNAVAGVAPHPVPATVLTFAGLVDGDYDVEWFDTVSGQKRAGAEVTVRNGVAELELPPIKTDVAIRLVPTRLLDSARNQVSHLRDNLSTFVPNAPDPSSVATRAE